MSDFFDSYLNGKKTEFVVLEDEYFMAIVEEKPLALGHCVVFPKQKVDHFFRLSDECLSRILVFSKPIAAAIEKLYPCQKVGLSVLGLQVRHAHLHLVPIQTADDLNFTKKRIDLAASELIENAKKIKAAISKN